MTITKKQKLVAMAFAFSAIIVAAVLFCLPSQALAAQLGTEEPHVYFTYEKDGEEVDGNNLAYDTKYFAKMWIKGVENLSTLEVTAAYDDTVTCSAAPDTLMSDNVADITSMGYLLNNGNMVFGFVSDNANNSAINPEGTLIASLEVTFNYFEGADDVLDAEHHISVSENPNMTFVQVDYADGYENEYAVADDDNKYGDYVGERYPYLTYNISPALASAGYDITGQVKIATDPTGTNTTAGIVGLTVSVVDAGGVTITSADTDAEGYYTLSGVPVGEYKMIISGPTTVDREVALNVSDSKTVDAVGVVVCDYNKDTFINGTDLGRYLTYHGKEYYVYCDFNGDGFVNGTDLGLYLKLHSKDIVYNKVTL